MIKIGYSNEYYRDNFINNPAFKKAKNVFKKARKNKYIPFHPLMENESKFETLMKTLRDEIFDLLNSKIKSGDVYDYSEFESDYSILWFGLDSDEKFEINITFSLTGDKIIIFINRVFIRSQSGNGIMTELFKTIDSAMKKNLIKYKIELEDHSDKMEDGRTRWQHLFDKLNGIKVEYI